MTKLQKVLTFYTVGKFVLNLTDFMC